MIPIYVAKSLGAASSNGLGSISTAGVVTLNTSALDTARRIAFFSSGTVTGVTITVKGWPEGFIPTSSGENTSYNLALLTESVSATAASYTTADFAALFSVSVSSAPNAPMQIGTSSLGGTPWKITDWMFAARPLQLAGQLEFSSTAAGTVASIEYTYGDVTELTGQYSDPYHTVPRVWTSSSPLTTASSNSQGPVAVDGQIMLPITAWRMTISSTSPTTTVYGTIFQAG